MRRSLSVVCLWVGLSGITLLQAQEEKRRPEFGEGKAREMLQRRLGSEGPPMGPGGMMAMMPLIAALDTDKDGSLSASEIANASKSLLTLDKNGDGILSREEMRPDPASLPGGMPRPGEGGPANAEFFARLFKSQDANGDGKLSGDEIPERMRERLAMIDENGDSAIDATEMQRVMARTGGKALERFGKDGKDGSGVRPKRPDPNN